ncbi:MAG: hypothetical protein EOO85_10620 [Pedobacter sp.]|nr:MAG: hypothetical protein EOO85_10620 [Pedobacter sp.]
MRTGKIAAYNNVVRGGYIKDENNQKIKFNVEEDRGSFKRNDQVQFDLSFRNGELRAVNVMHATDVDEIICISKE